MHLSVCTVLLPVLPIASALLVPTLLPIPPCPALRDIKKAFERADIVPDVISAFDPSAQIFLEWKEDMVVNPGTKVNKSNCSSPPTLTTSNLPFTPRGPYLLLTVDPDAPSHEDPKNSPFRHFLATDLYVQGELSQELPYAWLLVNESEAASEWYPPAPPPGSGPHRYVTLLYSQPKDVDLSFVDWDDRKKFNVTEFVNRAGLEEPVAGVFFVVEEAEDDAEEGIEGDGISQVVLGGY